MSILDAFHRGRAFWTTVDRHVGDPEAFRQAISRQAAYLPATPTAGREWLALVHEAMQAGHAVAATAALHALARVHRAWSAVLLVDVLSTVNDYLGPDPVRREWVLDALAANDALPTGLVTRVLRPGLGDGVPGEQGRRDLLALASRRGVLSFAGPLAAELRAAVAPCLAPVRGGPIAPSVLFRFVVTQPDFPDDQRLVWLPPLLAVRVPSGAVMNGVTPTIEVVSPDALPLVASAQGATFAVCFRELAAHDAVAAAAVLAETTPDQWAMLTAAEIAPCLASSVSDAHRLVAARALAVCAPTPRDASPIVPRTPTPGYRLG